MEAASSMSLGSGRMVSLDSFNRPAATSTLMARAWFTVSFGMATVSPFLNSETSLYFLEYRGSGMISVVPISVRSLPEAWL